MDEILKALVKELPNAVALILTVYLFLRREKEVEEIRTANAKALEDKREKHEKEINGMWAKLFNQMMRKMDINQETLERRIDVHEEAMNERYDKFQITDDLAKAAREAKNQT